MKSDLTFSLTAKFIYPDLFNHLEIAYAYVEVVMSY